MPDLTSMLRAHADELAHAPAEGFAGVTVRARRRTHRRALIASMTAAMVAVCLLSAGLWSGGRLRHAEPGVPTPSPTNPLPSIVQQAGTRWQLDAVTTGGHAQRWAGASVWLVVGWNGNWLMHTPCGNIAGAATFTDQLSLAFNQSPTQECKDRQGRALLSAFGGGGVAPEDPRSPATLTLHAMGGWLSFRAVGSPSSAALTEQRWRLTSVTDFGLTADVSSERNLTLLAGDTAASIGYGCRIESVTAVAGDGSLDVSTSLADAEISTCPGVNMIVPSAYRDLFRDGTASWRVTGHHLTISAAHVSLSYASDGPGTTPIRDPGAIGGATPVVIPDRAALRSVAGNWWLSAMTHGPDTGDVPGTVPAYLAISADGKVTGGDGCNTLDGRLRLSAAGQAAGVALQITQAGCHSLGGALEPLVDQALTSPGQRWRLPGPAGASADTLSISGGGVTLTYTRKA